MQTRPDTVASSFIILSENSGSFPRVIILFVSMVLLPAFPQGSIFSCLFNLFPPICHSLNLCPRPIDKWKSLRYLGKKCWTCFSLKLPSHNLLPLPSTFLRRLNYTHGFHSNTQQALNAFNVVSAPSFNWNQLPSQRPPGWPLYSKRSIQMRRRQVKSHYTLQELLCAGSWILHFKMGAEKQVVQEENNQYIKRNDRKGNSST